MAIVTLGGGVASASGSVGGMTFSRNRGGAYVRNRAVPTNPNTSQQQAVRSALSQLVTRWNDTLTPAQRAAWDVYAENTPLLNPLGEPRNVGGLGMFIRGNVPRIQAGIADYPLADAAPAVFNLGEYTAPAIASITAGTDLLSLTFDNTDDWANEDDAGMLVYTSAPQNPGVNYFKGPYRLADGIEGDSVTPPTSPASIALATPCEVGQRVFVMARVSRVDGRLSSPFRGGVLAV